MSLHPSAKWIVGALLAPIVLAVIFIEIFGWNWLRGPIERMAAEKSGRLLAINGDLSVKFAWPSPRLRAENVSFANPAWAKEKQMITSDAVEIDVDLPQLFRRNLVFPEVRLVRPAIFLEQGSDGKKNWLLDVDQQNEEARIRIDRLTLDHGMLGYDDVGQKTSIRSELSTLQTAPAGVNFTVKGQYKGMPLKAGGTGGAVLALRDDNLPYPLKVDITVGGTGLKAEGTITSLLKFSAMDVRLALRGESLAQLFPLLGIAFPETRAYATNGHLVHSGHSWRYDKFSGRIGKSDIAGSLEIETGGKRPAMKADLESKLLDLEDLGPLIGARPGSLEAAKQAAPAPSKSAATIPVRARVLPDIPFTTEHWGSVDAEVNLKAKAIRSANELPIDDLVTHLSLQDSVLKLDPLDFGVAGGHLAGAISLDGRKHPIQARARVRAKNILIARLFPKLDLNRSSVGHINGEFDLAGNGDSVGNMLASASGNVGLVVAGGEVSKLMMEKVGLHLWEILEIKVSGDRQVKLRCAVADFSVKDGVMNTDALIFDTEVTTIVGTGSIDLGGEKLDLTLNQKTKNTSPLALRSPIHIHGSFANAAVEVDKARVAARGFGALALGLINPLLALIPLIDPGPGKDSDCAQLTRDARNLSRTGNGKPVPRP